MVVLKYKDTLFFSTYKLPHRFFAGREMQAHQLRVSTMLAEDVEGLVVKLYF